MSDKCEHCPDHSGIVTNIDNHNKLFALIEKRFFQMFLCILGVFLTLLVGLILPRTSNTNKAVASPSRTETKIEAKSNVSHMLPLQEKQIGESK